MQSEPMFTISDVSQQTGVASVTLRAWERRYGLIKPQRTPKGHRLYSTDHISKIQQIQVWLNRGVAISKVATLLMASESVPDTVNDSHWQQTQLQLLTVLTDLKQTALNQALDMLNKSTPFISLCEHVYQPLHAQLEQRWQKKPLGYQLEQQLWQQCWQRQITLMTLRSEKHKARACCTLISMAGDQCVLDYWLFYGLLLQSGVRVTAINKVDDLLSVTRLSHTPQQSLIIFGEQRLSAVTVKQFSKIGTLWQGPVMVAGPMAAIHHQVLSDLTLNYTAGSANQCWQSALFQSWLNQLAAS